MVHIEDANEIFASAFSWTPLNLDLSTEHGKRPYISLNVNNTVFLPVNHAPGVSGGTLKDALAVKVRQPPLLNSCCASLQCPAMFSPEKNE